MAQRWAVVRLLDAGHALRRDLARDRRQHRDDHAHRLVAQPRRGRLPRDARQVDAGTTPAHRAMRERLRLAVPNKGRLVEPTLRLLHDAGPRLRGARPQPRRARPELRPRHPVRADERRHRVRRRRRRRPRDHRHRPPDRDRRRAAARPRARLRPLPPGRRRPDRRPVPDRRGPGRPPRRDRPPEHGPSLLRGARHRRRRHPDLGRRRGRAAARPRRGHRRPRLDRLDAGHERPAPDRRRPRSPRRSSSPTRPPTASARPSSPRSTRCSAPSSRRAAAST